MQYMEYDCNERQMYILLHTVSGIEIFLFLLTCFLKLPFLLLGCSLSHTECRLGKFLLRKVP